jgi:hypothetical protein
MPTFVTYPDQRYYTEVTQHDDGSFSANPKPLVDQTVNRMDPTTGVGKTYVYPGLRSTVTNTMINPFAENYILSYAPEWAQRNANNIIAQPSLYTTQQVTDAKAMWTWITAVIARANELQAQVEAMSFEQIVAFVVPAGPWPPPPASLTIPLPP